MNLKNYISGLALLGLVFSSAANAQAIKKVDVVELLDVKGKVSIERLDGSQYPAQKGAIIAHGSKMVVFEGGQAKAKYLKNKCEVVYKQNRVVNIRQDKQCSAGVAVINANKYAKFGNGSNPGCCVVKTITVPSASSAGLVGAGLAGAGLAGAGLAGSTVAGTTFGGLSGLGLLGAGLATAGVVAVVADDDDKDKPLSPAN